MVYQANLQYTNLPRSGLALGGIGAGSMELRHDGALHRWSIFNNYPSFTGPRLTLDEPSLLFFKIRYQEPGKPPRIKLLQIDTGYAVAGMTNQVYEFPWMTGIQSIEYAASFPFTTLTYCDDTLPFSITLRAFSPFIPHDVKNSALPVAIFTFNVTAQRPVKVNLLATLRNGVGYDTTARVYRTALLAEQTAVGVLMTCDGMDTRSSSYGSQALYSLNSVSRYYTGWGHRHPYYEIVLRQDALPNVDDTPARHKVDSESGQRQALDTLYSTLGLARDLAPGEDFTHSFMTTWHFPNLYNARDPLLRGQSGTRREGHYYNNFFADAAAVGHYVLANLDDLHTRTRQFHDAFYDSTVDPVILDQINSHLNTFVCGGWLTEAGDFGIQEGVTDTEEWGPIATIDVGLYGSVAALCLFPELDRAMLKAHQAVQKPSGEISHGIPRDFAHHEPLDKLGTRVDLTSQYTLMAARHYLWAGDTQFLEGIWASVKAALAFSRREQDKDQDAIPDMNGESSSYDNFSMYGASSYVGSLWLAALQHARVIAEALDDHEAAAHYQKWHTQALETWEKLLWNGTHYRLFNDSRNGHGHDDGCLTDQLIGEWLSHQSAVPFSIPADRRQAVVRYIYNVSYEPGFGLRNCSWVGDGYLHDIPEHTWFDQANSLWSGVELAFASFLTYEGLTEEAFAIIRTVDARYRSVGRYFDHQEWGGHYYRPMSSWAIINALAGLSLHAGKITLAPRINQQQAKLFLALPQATAHYVHDLPTQTAELRILTGVLTGHRLIYTPPSSTALRAEVHLSDGRSHPVQLSNGSIILDSALTLTSGETLTWRWW